MLKLNSPRGGVNGVNIPHSCRLLSEVIMTKYRFSRGEDGKITVRAERIVGKQLVSSITRVILPGEDVLVAMKELHRDVQIAGRSGRLVQVIPGEPRVGE